MPEDAGYKIKLLKLMELLRDETDEAHPMMKTDICTRMTAMGIPCERHTLARDIQVLRAYNYEIMDKMVGHSRAYYFADRCFSLPEVKILIDAVEAANFIPDGKTQELVGKIASLAGSHEAEVLKGNIVHFNTHKGINNQIYYNVQALKDALELKQQASFFYFDRDEKGGKIYRKAHERYTVEPVALIYEEDNYYLLTWSEIHQSIVNYRVDRMDEVSTEEHLISAAARSLLKEAGDYNSSAFKMFGGPDQSVTLEFDRALIASVLDRFGEGTKMSAVDKNSCRAVVKVQVSQVFFAWVFQFNGRLRITGPKHVCDRFAEQLAKFR